MRFFLCLALVGFAAVLTSAGEKAKPFANTADEVKIFELTNQERKNKDDAPPLKLSIALSKVARAHSENMARQGKMAHDLDGKTPFDRLRTADYDYAKAGENVAMADKEAKLPMIMKGWMDSKGHRENILRPEFTEIGIGIAHDQAGQVYYTQLFGRPRK